MSFSQQLCTFLVSEQLFGVEVSSVQEVIRDQAATRIPLSPRAVAGLINLRGQIVPIVDLRACLSLPPQPADCVPTNVVVNTEEGVVSLRVDAIGEVLDLGAEAFEKTPDNVRGIARQLVRGVYKLDRGLLLVLSLDDAIEAAVTSGTAQL